MREEDGQYGGQAEEEEIMELLGFAILLIVIALFVIEWRLKKLMQTSADLLKSQREIANLLREWKQKLAGED